MQNKLYNKLWLATVLCFVLSAAGAAEMPDRVGTIVRIQGQAVELPQGFGSRPLHLGAPVHAQGKIKTGPNARLEIGFIDGTKMTLGEWAHVDLDVNLKDKPPGGEQAAENDDSDSMSISFLAGTFRFITGLLAKANSQSVRLQTQVATIGIRGTDLFGGPLAAGMPPGEIHYGFMILEGAIDIDNPHGSVTLDSPKEGTFLPMKGHKAPTPPSVWNQQAIDEAFASIEFN